MQLIYNLLNSRWKLPLVVVCVAFNITILLYIARPATPHIVFENERPQQGLQKYMYADNTNILATTATKTLQKEKLVMNRPITFVRHFASKVNSLRSVKPKRKENVNISTTVEDGGENVNYQETKIQSMEFPKTIEENTAVDDDTRPLMENLVSKLSLQRHNDFNFKYLINPFQLCQGDTYLLIAVCSAVRRVDFRKAIRETWGSVVRKEHLGVKLVFVVGAPSEENVHMQSVIQTESDMFHDVLQINHVDHSRNLSFKTLGLFHWIKDHCKNATFVMKTDDDIFMNTRDLLKEVKELSTRSKVIMGHLIKGAQPITDRNDPWYNPPGIYQDRTYPDYLSGSAYLFPSSLIPLLLKFTNTNPVFWLEDIYVTGILAKSAKISLLNNPDFVYIKPEVMFNFCKYSKVQVVHGISSEEMRTFWKALNNLNC